MIAPLRTTLFLAAVSILLAQPTLAAAINPYRTLQTPFYDPNTSVASCTESSALIGSQNDERIFNFFTSKGLSAFQAAGIIGNMSVESGLEPQRLQGTAPGEKTPAESFSGGSGWGIVQWTPGSKFIDLIKPISRANDLGVQLQFLWNQLDGKGPLQEKQAGDELKKTIDVESATIAFQGTPPGGTVEYGGKNYGPYYGFERPEDKQGSVKVRVDYAKNILIKYGSNAGGSSSSDSSVCASGESGDTVGNYSLPLDRKWYVQNKNYFTKPHHDYSASDIPVPEGTPVYSITAGKITRITNDEGCGKGVFVDAGNGAEIGYCHSIDAGSIAGAKQGDQVSAGQLIMRSGNTGSSTGPHLHVQIKVKGQLRCPQPLFTGIVAGTVPSLISLPATGCSYKSTGGL